MATAGYPPPQDAMYTLNSSTLEVADDARQLSRTPSPTPSEMRALKFRLGTVDWKTVASRKFWFRREWLWYYVIVVVILIISTLVSMYHKQIVTWLTPFTKWVHELEFGWLVPIAVLFVISFPPLFGHEMVSVLCGLVWGLWAGFGIVAAGTFLGEVGNFYAFKYCCRGRGEKLEQTNILYACLAQVVRDGGFKIALIVRLSAIPAHFTTAVFSTCGMDIFVFSLAALLSLPKQFVPVYLGVILAESHLGVKHSATRIISDIVLVLTFIGTVAAMWYIFLNMNKVKPQVIYARRKARQAKLIRARDSPYMNAGVDGFNSTDSVSDNVPLMGADQHWEEHAANAVEYVPADPILYTPKPRRVNPDASFDFTISKFPRDEEAGAGQSFIGHGHDRRESGESGTASLDLDSDVPLIREFEFSRSRGVIVASPSR